MEMEPGCGFWPVVTCLEIAWATLGTAAHGISANIDHSDITILLDLPFLIGNEPAPVPLHLGMFHGA